ncbi:Large subunit GTPase 1 like [Glycine soja]|nr:Large subunit GTPase 1 like [Glycine soja]
MGKKQNEIQKRGLGRALLSRFYRKKFLESFTEVSNIDTVVEQSLEPLPKLAAAASTTLISLEPGSVPDETTTPKEARKQQARKQQKQEEALHASNLRVPRHPLWTPNMSADELNASETQAFLTWRRSLAR